MRWLHLAEVLELHRRLGQCCSLPWAGGKSSSSGVFPDSEPPLHGWEQAYRPCRHGTEPTPYQALVGNLCSAYFRRLNIQHRLVYQMRSEEGVVKVLRLRTHYE
jgi:hypothetical protein